MIFKADIRIVLIIALAIALFFSLDGCDRVIKLFEGEEVVSEKTTTKTETKVFDRTFVDIQPFPDIFIPTLQKIQIKDGKVKEVPDSTPADSSETVNKYQTVNELPNGTIKGSLLIRGELLSAEYELTTSDTVITNTTETIRTVVKSGLFGVGGSTIGLDGRIKDVQAGFSYSRKNN